MKVLIYDNKIKNNYNKFTKKLKECLDVNNILYEEVDLLSVKEYSGDILIVLGGDGTILHTVDFATKNDLPLIGINTGRLGYLTEFENNEIEKAIEFIKSKNYFFDKRNTTTVIYKDKKYIALNDVVLQRNYNDNSDGMILSVGVNIDGIRLENISGDGVIVSTPTGSTAYSLSAGGAILTPTINAFCVTPISAHSLSSRPIVYSADSTCVVDILNDNSSGLFIDGKLVSSLNKNDRIEITKTKKSLVFLRQNDFNFYERLLNKLSGNEK